MPHWNILLLALMVSLSGCAGSGGLDEAGATEGVPMDGTAAGAAQNLTLARFDDDPQAVDLEFAGSFAAGEPAECYGTIDMDVGGPVDLCTGDPQYYDLTSSFESGHAYVIYANATDKDDAGSGISLRLSHDEGWSQVDVNESMGEVRLVGRLIRLSDTPVELVVEHFLSFADVPYAISVEIRQVEGWFVPMVPVALGVDPGASRMVLPAQPDGAVRIWDGDDRFIGHFPLDAGLDLDLEGVQTRQGLVLQFLNVSEGLSVQVAQETPATLHYLSTEVEQVQAGAITGVPDNDWEVEVDSVPLRIGLYFGAEGRWNTWETDFYLEAPEGQGVSEHTGCFCAGYAKVPLLFDGEAPALGSYHVGARAAEPPADGAPWPATAQGVEVGLYLVHYVR